MRLKAGRALILFSSVLLAIDCLGQPKASKLPLEELPTYVKQVTHFGERADWSHDGKRILFLEKTFGDILFDIELRITCQFDRVCIKNGKTEHGEDIANAHPDNIIEEYDINILIMFRENEKP